MPQMAPMNWTTLLIYFFIMFLLTNTINFFNSMNNPTTSKQEKLNKYTNWKW